MGEQRVGGRLWPWANDFRGTHGTSALIGFLGVFAVGVGLPQVGSERSSATIQVAGGVGLMAVAYVAHLAAEYLSKRPVERLQEAIGLSRGARLVVWLCLLLARFMKP